MGVCSGSNREVLKEESVLGLQDEKSNQQANNPNEQKKKMNNINKSIEEFMTQQQRESSKIKKLLLLGSGSSGKSTIFKQLKNIYNSENFLDDDIMEARPSIRRNVVLSMLKLLKQANELYESDNNEFKELKIDLNESSNDKKWQLLMKDIQLLIYLRNESFDSVNVMYSKETCLEIRLSGKEEKEDVDLVHVNNVLLNAFPDNELPRLPDDGLKDWKLFRELGNAVGRLWELTQIKKTFELRGVCNFAFIENMDYFFDKCSEIFKRSYWPSTQDMLKSRTMTTGIVNAVYEVEDKSVDISLNIFDVGGQRNERKKWIHQFDSVTAVIFVAALNHYCYVLFEDEQVNSMIESLRLFHEVCNSKWFKNTEIILFLNKEDLFKQQIKNGRSLKLCFNENNRGQMWGWERKLPFNVYSGPDYYDSKELRIESYQKLIIDDKQNTNNINNKKNEKQETNIVNVNINDNKEWFSCVYEHYLYHIRESYVLMNQAYPKKSTFVHVTTATDPANIENVFNDVQNIVIRENLIKAGLY